MSDTRLQTSLDQVLSIPSVRAEHPNLHAGATAELATLRAQLEEAKDVISQMYFAITPNKHATLALLEAQRRAYQYLDSVKSGD